MNLRDLTNEELIEISYELSNNTIAENSIVRTIAKENFGGDSLTQLLGVGNLVLPIIAERLKDVTSIANNELIDSQTWLTNGHLDVAKQIYGDSKMKCVKYLKELAEANNHITPLKWAMTFVELNFDKRL